MHHARIAGNIIVVEKRRVELRTLILQGSAAARCFPQNGAESWFRANIFRSSDGRVNHHHYLGKLVRKRGLEPRTTVWHTASLPLTYFRMVPHPGNDPGQPEGVSFTDCAASLAAY
jgi:hypothetical protein